jgi:hypothetical protein
LFLTPSCKKYKPAPDAFFIRSSAAVSVTSFTTQGTTSHNITDLFLYINGQFQGTYPVGNLMPIVTKGQDVTIDVFAGVKNNGIKSTTIPYPLFDKIEIDTFAGSGKNFARTFAFNYIPGVQFPWLEAFETPGISLVLRPGTDTVTLSKYRKAGSPNSFEGKYSGYLWASNGYTLYAESSVDYALPKGNSNVFLEMNYKCDADFFVGVSDSGTDREAIGIKAHSDWNKIYISLANVVSISTADKVKIYFKIPANTDGGSHVWLDNIKLVYL